MADKSFGIKELNLVGASGVPTIESPNNLNLNAVNVAISTDVSIGSTCSIGGTCSATTFYGSGAGLTNLQSGGTATTSTYAGSWVLGANGTSDYTFTVDGLTGTVNDPTLYLQRGKKYIFKNRSGGHPFRIQSTTGTSGTPYNTGVTNNAGSNGTDIIFEVPQGAPGKLYYQCTAHANMSGTLYIDVGYLNDGTTNVSNVVSTGVTPTSHNTMNLGTDAIRWANVYTTDLQLSNKGDQNEVDGTWGDYTIQEGESDLFLINRRNGKKYKFMLQEVD